MSDGDHSDGLADEPPVPLTRAMDDYLLSKGKGPDGESGLYRTNAERQLRKFVGYLDAQGITRLAEIDAEVLRTYVRDALLGDGLSPRTVRKYFDYVSAWIGWAQREGLVDTHYGLQQTAREPLPDVDTRKRTRQQSWRRDQRRAILTHVDERARDAIDDRGLDAYAAVRDRALVYVLAYSGVRGSELLANSQDDRRDGARWRDLGDEYDTLEVLGKRQEWESRSVPPQAHSVLERWEQVLDPAGDWPLVPTLHYPSLYEALATAGRTETESLTGHADVFAALRDHGASPPAMTTDGARRLLQRLTDDAGIDVDEGYLQLHGARRGVGRVLAMQQGADEAADQLGNSVAVVEESYSDILASERAEKTGEAFDEHDG
jgi:integrase